MAAEPRRPMMGCLVVVTALGVGMLTGIATERTRQARRELADSCTCVCTVDGQIRACHAWDVEVLYCQ